MIKGSIQKNNCDYSDIVPISFYTYPPKGDRDKIEEITLPPSPCDRDIQTQN